MIQHPVTCMCQDAKNNTRVARKLSIFSKCIDDNAPLGIISLACMIMWRRVCTWRSILIYKACIEALGEIVGSCMGRWSWWFGWRSKPMLCQPKICWSRWLLLTAIHLDNILITPRIEGVPCPSLRAWNCRANGVAACLWSWRQLNWIWCGVATCHSRPPFHSCGPTSWFFVGLIERVRNELAPFTVFWTLGLPRVEVFAIRHLMELQVVFLDCLFNGPLSKIWYLHTTRWSCASF